MIPAPIVEPQQLGLELIPQSAVRPTDVLLGRGRPIQNHPGNVHLRSVAIAARKDDYVAATANAAKDRLAREVMNCVLSEGWMDDACINPTAAEQSDAAGEGATATASASAGAGAATSNRRGRFLRQATEAELTSAGIATNQRTTREDTYWTPADEAAVLTKMKQMLRQDRPRQPGCGWGRGPGAAGAAAAAQNSSLVGNDQQAAAAVGETVVSSGVAMATEVASPAAAPPQLPAAAAAAPAPAPAPAPAANISATDATSPPISETNTGACNATSGPVVHVNQDSSGGPTIREWVNAEMIRSMTLHGSQVDEADRHYQQKAAALSLTLLRMVALYHGNGIAFGGDAIGATSMHVCNSNCVSGGGDRNDSDGVYRIAFDNVVSQSPPLQPTSAPEIADRVRSDLHNSGAVLYEIFSGVAPFQEEKEVDALMASLSSAIPSTQKKRSRTAVATNVTPLRDLGLPTAVDSIVMDLIDIRTKGASESDDAIRKVAADSANIFQLMVENPQQYLFDLYDSSPVSSSQGASNGTPPRLVFPKDRLYGREESSAILASIFNRIIGKGGHEAVMVSGYSGIGKTSLVRQLRQPTRDRGGFFLAGKFDALQQARPLSAIVMALNTYCDDLMSRRNDINFIQVQAAIQGVIEGGSDLLTQLIPNLQHVLMAGPTGSRVQSTHNADLYANADAETVDSQAINRLMHSFRKLFDAMAAPMHPVVLFLDDLQWADDLSLTLILSLVSEGDKRAFLFVGAYRSNEVEEDHPLLSQLDNIRLAGATVNNIVLDNMSKSSVNTLVSDVLQLSPLLTEPLAETVHSKTSGNCLFVVELLTDLERQGLLHYSLRTQRWEWEADAISTMTIHTNVVDLMRRKLIRLGATESLAIKIAACLGAEAGILTLRVLSGGLGLPEESSLATILQHTVEEGLMYRTGDSFRFSHDQIQQAAYSLIGVSERASFHLMIGRSLEARALLTSAEGTLFTCVDQFNRGLPLINSRSERSNLTSLNLRAGKAAISSSAYATAAVYLRMAASLLDFDAWECDYDLCLEIYNCLAEAEYATGKYEEMTFALNEILERAREYSHKLRAYYTLMSASAAQNDLKAAVSIGFEVLGQLGEPFDENANAQAILTELSYTKGMLVSKDRQWFRTHRVMSDEKKLYAMKFLYVLALYVFLTAGSKASLIACRMIQLSVQYGLCKQSAFGFAVYGMGLCGVLADYEEAYEAGKLAWVIMNNFQAKDILARCSVVVCGCINIWVEPLQAILPQLMEAYNATIASGDPEFALLSLRHYIAMSLHSGRPLGDAADDCRTLVNDANVYRMQLMSTLNESLWQAILNLSERCSSSDPTILSGEVMQEDEYILSLIEKNNNIGTCYFYLMKLTMACIFGRFDRGMEMYEKCMDYDLPKAMMGKFESITCTFYGCLAALVMKRKRPEQSVLYNEIIDNAIRKMEKWASVSSWNCEHKLALLQAEVLWTSGDREGAAKAYEKTTRLASEHGFPNEEGLARERYGAFLSSDEVGDESSSRRQYDLAYEAYAKWGAQRKCLDLQVQGYTDGRGGSQTLYM